MLAAGESRGGTAGGVTNGGRPWTQGYMAGRYTVVARALFSVLNGRRA